MKAFAALYAALDASTATLAKVAALKRYFAQAAPRDAAWAVYFLAGGKPRQVVSSRVLREFAVQTSGVPEWLFEESYQAVGDLAETIALLLPPPTCADAEAMSLADWIETRLAPLRGRPAEEVKAALALAMNALDVTGRFLLIKLIGGGFRVGVSRLLVTRALAELTDIDAARLAQRMIGWTDEATAPTAQAYARLVAPVAVAALRVEGDGAAAAESNPESNPESSPEPGSSDAATDGSPYPFFLAQQLTVPVNTLGAVEDWLIEWKYDGIRGQLVRRGGRAWLWSRGEELITERFPELQQAAAALPDGLVLDGEIVVWDGLRNAPAAFALLQTRIGRKSVGAKLLRDAPAAFVVYDLLEIEGRDLRGLPQAQRRAELEALALTAPMFMRSPRLQPGGWAEAAALRSTSRTMRAEGLMLKRLDARYGVGRTREAGIWWKWKIDPMSVDAVLVYAQRGHGRRASLYTDYTFAVWDRAPLDAREAQAVCAAIAAGKKPDDESARGLPRLVPFAKAYSGLTDAEIKTVDAIVRRSTVEQFGPVRSVVPQLVFTLGFEGIQRSSRHKSGIAVRFPRMLHQRLDKPLHEADTLASLQCLLDLDELTLSSEPGTGAGAGNTDQASSPTASHDGRCAVASGSTHG